MKSADYVVSFLVSKGCDKAFVFTGGAISHVIDAFRNFEGDIDYVCVQNEQVGAMAAEAYSRTSGRVGVAMATSGPGATNLVTGIAGAYYDCVPVLCIVGQVRTYELSGAARLLQRGFQEVDIVRMTAGITKYAVTITRAEDLRFELEKAWHLATTGRPGPVLIDLPMDMQWAEVDPPAMRPFSPPVSRRALAADIATEVVRRLDAAEKPLIIAGGGVARGEARAALARVASRCAVPVVTTYAGRDTIPWDHPVAAGVIGQFGTPAANALTGQADLVLSLGARHTIRQVGNAPALFAPNAFRISVNIDEGELADGRVVPDLPVCADVRELLDALGERPGRPHTDWLDRAAGLKARLGLDVESVAHADPVNPYRFMSALCDIVDDNAILVADTGQSLVCAAQALRLKQGQRFFSSWAHSPMGYAVAAAIGAQLANPGRQVVAIIGDGGLHVNLQDLQTLVYYRVPVKILLFNNRCYGLIQEFQDPNLAGRHAATDADHGYAPPDYGAVARAFGIPFSVMQSDRDTETLREALGVSGPAICELPMDPRFRIIGLVPGTNALHDMAPPYGGPWQVRAEDAP